MHPLPKKTIIIVVDWTTNMSDYEKNWTDILENKKLLDHSETAI